MNILSKTLITGANGMVGSYVDFGIKLGRHDLDITNAEAVLKTVKKYKPKCILHLAAETDVNKCERDPARAYLVNSIGTYNLATAAREIGAKMIYISTNAVFNGKKKSPYAASDTPHPADHYGFSKYFGELAVKTLLKDYLIIRTSWVMGGADKDKKFVGKIIRQLFQPSVSEIKATIDQIGSPTYGKDLMEGIKILIKKNMKGTVHLSNSGVTSRYGIAKYIADLLRPGAKIVGVPAKYFGVLSKNEALKTTIIKMRPWQEALAEYLQTEWI